MKYFLCLLSLCGALFLSAARTSADVTVTVDSSAPWQGYMNVSELPENGSFYVFGSDWGVIDLTAEFVGSELTLKPAPMITGDSFWYVNGVGGEGAAGNKTMEANVYVENSDTFVGENITFEGNVLSNSWVAPYDTVAFIKDFAPDYSTFNMSTVPLTTGNFSVTLATDPAPGRHVQYGFATTGPNVWPTDVDLHGKMVIEAIASPNLPGDLNGDGEVTGRDFLFWQRGETTPAHDAALLAEWQGAYNGGGLAGISVVPEPASLSLISAFACGLLLRRTRLGA